VLKSMDYMSELYKTTFRSELAFFQSGPLFKRKSSGEILGQNSPSKVEFIEL